VSDETRELAHAWETFASALQTAGRRLIEQTELWLRRAARFRASERAASLTLVDVDYAELVRDTPAALRRIYEAYHAAAPRGARGVHRYQPEDLGLDPAQLRERFA
jgi:hypothetical protein